MPRASWKGFLRLSLVSTEGPRVRIPFPPAESASLNENEPAEVEKRGFSRECAGHGRQRIRQRRA